MEFTGERYIPGAIDVHDAINYEHLNRYSALKKLIKNKVILDAACGSGYGCSMMSSFAKKVHGIDIDPGTIDYAKSKYAQVNIEFQVAPVSKLPFKANSFDIIVSFETIEHINETDQELFLKEIKRTLKSGGYLVMSTPDKANYSDESDYNNEFHLKEFYSEEFYDFLQPYFNHVEILNQSTEVCNIIGNSSTQKLDVILNNKEDLASGKYMFAVCSDKKIELTDFGSIEIQTGKHGKFVKRIYDLQEEVEEKNKWAFSLNDEIEKLRNIINTKNNNLEGLRTALKANQDKSNALESNLKTFESDSTQEKEIKEILKTELEKAHESYSSLNSKLLDREKALETFMEKLSLKEKAFQLLQSNLLLLKTDLKSLQAKEFTLVEQKEEATLELLNVKKIIKQEKESKTRIELDLVKISEKLVLKEELVNHAKLEQIESDNRLKDKAILISQLQSDLRDTNTKIQFKEKELQDKAEKYKKLNEELSQWKTQNDSQATAQKEIEKTLQLTSENLRKKEKEVNELSSQAEAKKEVEKELKLSLENLKKKEDKLIEISSQVNVYKIEVESKSKESEVIQGKLENKNTQVKDLTKELSNIRSNFEKELDLNKQSHNEIRALQENLESSRLSELKILNSKTALDSELETVQEKYFDTQKKFELATENFKVAEKHKWKIENEIAEEQRKNEMTQHLVGLKEAEVEEKNDLISGLEKNLDSQNKELNQFSIDLVSLQKDLEFSTQVVKKIKKTRNSLKDQLIDAQLSVKAKEEQLKNLETNLDQALKQSNENETKLRDLETKHNGSVRRIINLQDEVDEKNNWAFALKDEIKGKDFQMSQFNKQLTSSELKQQFLTNKIENLESFQALKSKHIDTYAKSVLLSKRNLLSLIRNKKELEEAAVIYSELNEQFERIPNEFLHHFSTEKYLEENIDVKYAIERGDFNGALEHFIFFGFIEIERGDRKIYETFPYYNEDVFLNEFPKLKGDVSSQKYKTPFQNYLAIGLELISENQIEPQQPNIETSESFETIIEEKPRLNNFKVELINGLKIIDPEKSSLISVEKLIIPIFKVPVVSIVVPAYNQANYTFACIKSIVEHTIDIPYEIILIDDNSPNTDASELDKQIENLVFIKNEENLGFLLNCNKAAKGSKGKYILFLNNDTNVQPNWLNSLVELIESDSKIGMVGSHLVYPDGRQQEAGGIIWNDASGWNYGRLGDRDKPEYNYTKEVDYISGAAIMIQKKLWDEIGGFDERFVPAYYEDTDLAFEVRKHGYKVMYQPQSIVVHFEGISNGTDLGSGIKKYQQINFGKFFDKWKEVLESEHYENAKDVFVSRDRSQRKTHILFVDHYLPHYDQDAGSKAAFQYLQLLAKSNIQVHFIGDNFWHYPDTPYQQALTDMGIEVLSGNWYANNWKNWLSENGKYLDYVILSRPHISEKYIDLVKEVTDAKVIYFGHDLHFLREQREYEVKKEAKYLESSESWKTKELDLISKSDVSYFFSDVEKSVIKEINPELSVNVVPLYIFDQFKKVKYNPNTRNNIMFVGGFSHAPNSHAVKWFVNECWPTIKQNVDNIHFYVIGSNPPQDILDLASECITVTGYINDEELNNYYNECKLAVAPLRYGAGVKGKVVDALYQGIPLVTTSIGAEGLSNPEDFIGVADDSEAFTKLVSDYYMNPKILKKLSKKSNQYCQDFFSEAYAKEQMAKIILTFKSTLN